MIMMTMIYNNYTTVMINMTIMRMVSILMAGSDESPSNKELGDKYR